MDKSKLHFIEMGLATPKDAGPDESSALNQNLDSIRRRFHELSSENSILKKNYLETRLELSQLNKEVHAQNLLVSQKDFTIEELNRAIKYTTESRNELQSRLEEKQTQIGVADRKVSEMQIELNFLSEQKQIRANLEVQLEKSKQAFHKSKIEMATIEKLANDLIIEKEVINQDRQGLRVRNQLLEEALGNLQKEKDKLYNSVLEMTQKRLDAQERKNLILSEIQKRTLQSAPQSTEKNLDIVRNWMSRISDTDSEES